MCGRARFALLAANWLACYCDPNSNNSNAINNDNSNNSSNNNDSKNENNNKRILKTIQNISPGFDLPILYLDNKNKLTVELMKWGLIPKYLKQPTKSDYYRIFNKRIESLLEPKQYFNNIIIKSRCIVVIDGYYEWKVIGIYDESYLPNEDKNTNELVNGKSFSIITTDSCENFSNIHDRQPLLLTEDLIKPWLLGCYHAVTNNSNDNNSNTNIIKKEIKTTPDELHKLLLELNSIHLLPSFATNSSLAYHTVTTSVSNPKYQEIDCSVEKSTGLQTITSLWKNKNSSKGNNSLKTDHNDTTDNSNNIKTELGKRIHIINNSNSKASNNIISYSSPNKKAKNSMKPITAFFSKSPT